MPMYEFLCQTCHKKVSFLVKSLSTSFALKCPNCKSTDMERTISSFVYHKSMKTVWEESGEPKMFSSPDHYKDPCNIGRWSEKRFEEMGIEIPTQMREKIQAAREGEVTEVLKGATSDAVYH